MDVRKRGQRWAEKHVINADRKINLEYHPESLGAIEIFHTLHVNSFDRVMQWLEFKHCICELVNKNVSLSCLCVGRHKRRESKFPYFCDPLVRKIFLLKKEVKGGRISQEKFMKIKIELVIGLIPVYKGLHVGRMFNMADLGCKMILCKTFMLML